MASTTPERLRLAPVLSRQPPAQVYLPSTVFAPGRETRRIALRRYLPAHLCRFPRRMGLGARPRISVPDNHRALVYQRAAGGEEGDVEV